MRVRPQQNEQRVHRRLSETEAVLNAEEPEVHPRDVAGRHEGTALVVLLHADFSDFRHGRCHGNHSFEIRWNPRVDSPAFAAVSPKVERVV